MISEQPNSEPLDLLSNPSFRGCVFAKGEGSLSNWLLIISHVTSEDYGLCVHRLLSYDTKRETFGIISASPMRWGIATEFTFYIATDEQKKFMRDYLTKLGLKYSRVLNKLIQR